MTLTVQAGLLAKVENRRDFYSRIVGRKSLKAPRTPQSFTSLRGGERESQKPDTGTHIHVDGSFFFLSSSLVNLHNCQDLICPPPPFVTSSRCRLFFQRRRGEGKIEIRETSDTKNRFLPPPRAVGFFLLSLLFEREREALPPDFPCPSKSHNRVRRELLGGGGGRLYDSNSDNNSSSSSMLSAFIDPGHP